MWTHSSRVANGPQHQNRSALTKEQLHSYLHSHTESKRIAIAWELQVSAREVLQQSTSCKTLLPSLPYNTPVWIQTENTHIPGTVVEQATTPRSYIISTPTGQ